MGKLKGKADLPAWVQGKPKKAQELYIQTFNSGCDENKGLEEAAMSMACHKLAIAALEKAGFCNDGKLFSPFVADLRSLADNPPKDGKSWVELFTVGEWPHREYGIVKFTKDMFDGFVRNFKQNVLGIKPIFDYNHSGDDPTVKAEDRGLASGEIQDLRIKGSSLWGLVEWTKKGLQKIMDKEFKYTSGSYTENYTDRQGNKVGPLLFGAALTNDPFLRLPPIDPNRTSLGLCLSNSAFLDLAGEDNSKGDYGDVHYADPGFQTDKKPRYPLESADHVRSAWSYINQGDNRKPYSAEHLKHIEGQIISAWKAQIDEAGPPSESKQNQKREGGGTMPKHLEQLEALLKAATTDEQLLTGVRDYCVKVLTVEPSDKEKRLLAENAKLREENLNGQINNFGIELSNPKEGRLVPPAIVAMAQKILKADFSLGKILLSEGVEVGGIMEGLRALLTSYRDGGSVKLGTAVVDKGAAAGQDDGKTLDLDLIEVTQGMLDEGRRLFSGTDAYDEKDPHYLESLKETEAVRRARLQNPKLTVPAAMKVVRELQKA